MRGRGRPGGGAVEVRRAWERARDAGIYNFATDLTQIAYPACSLANVGRGPDRIELHMEGEIDQPARTLEFRLWQPGMGSSGGAARRRHLDVDVAGAAGVKAGQIVITGTLDPALTPPLTITNAVTITTPLEGAPGHNVASVRLPVVPEIEQPTPRVWLPWVVH